MSKKSILLLILLISFVIDSYSWIAISVQRKAGKGKDGYAFVFENFMRDPTNSANCMFKLNCTGNAETQCQWTNLDPLNTPGCVWLVFTGNGSGGVGTMNEYIFNLVLNQVAVGNNSGNIVPSGIQVNNGITSESIFMHYDVNIASGIETIDIKIYSLSEAQLLGLTN